MLRWRATGTLAASPHPTDVVRPAGVSVLTRYIDGVDRGLLVSKGMINLIGEHAVRFSPAATGAQPDGLDPTATTGGGLAVPDS